jgi:hypothetical protein
MQYEDAKTELLRHAGIAEDYYEEGFLACLRPYSGLKAENFHAVVEAVLSVGTVFASAETMERSIVHSMWSIKSMARVQGIDDNSMLVRNRLISPEDHDKLSRWVDILERMMLRLLHGQSASDSMSGYCEYVAEYGWGQNLGFFLPLLSEAIASDDAEGDMIQAYCEAIIAAGPKAAELKAVLLKARKRKWTWYEPHKRCNAEMRGYIDRALDAIANNPDKS